MLYISEYKKTYLSNVLFYKIDTTLITLDKGKRVLRCRSEFENLSTTKYYQRKEQIISCRSKTHLRYMREKTFRWHFWIHLIIHLSDQTSPVLIMYSHLVFILFLLSESFSFLLGRKTSCKSNQNKQINLSHQTLWDLFSES